MAVALVVVFSVGAVSVLIAFVQFLRFCRFVVHRTGGTAGLRDVAVAIRAFASIGSLGPRPRPIRFLATRSELDPGETGQKTTMTAVQLAAEPDSTASQRTSTHSAAFEAQMTSQKQNRWPLQKSRSLSGQSDGFPMACW